MIVMGGMNVTGDPQGVGKPSSSALINDIEIMKEGKFFFSPYSKSNNNVFAAQHNKENVFSKLAEAWKAKRDIDSSLPKLYVINCSYENNGFNIQNYVLGTTDSDSRWDLFLRKNGGSDHFTIPEDTVNSNNSLFYTAQKAIRSALIEFAKEGKRAFHVGTVWNGFEQEIDSNNYGVNSFPANIRFLRNMIDEALGLTDSDFHIWKPMSNHNDFNSTLNKFQQHVNDLAVSENNVFVIDPSSFTDYDNSDSHLGIFNDYSTSIDADILSTDKKYYTSNALASGADAVINKIITSGANNSETITRGTAVCLDVNSLILSPKLLNGGKVYDHKLLRQTRFNLYGTLTDVSFAYYDSVTNTTSFSMNTSTRDVPLPSGTTTVLVDGISTTIVSSTDEYSIVVSGDQTNNNNFTTGADITDINETIVVDVLLNETDQTLV